MPTNYILIQVEYKCRLNVGSGHMLDHNTGPDHMLWVRFLLQIINDKKMMRKTGWCVDNNVASSSTRRVGSHWKVELMGRGHRPHPGALHLVCITREARSGTVARCF